MALEAKSRVRWTTPTGAPESVRPAVRVDRVHREIIGSHDERLSRRGHCPGAATTINTGSSWLPKALPVATVLRDIHASHGEPASFEPLSSGIGLAFSSSLQLLISNLQFLIVTLELKFPVTPTKQTLYRFSNRYKTHFLRPESPLQAALFASSMYLPGGRISNRESAIRNPRKRLQRKDGGKV
jgi:hypothetical protein